MPEIERVWKANMLVYGADKVWQQLGRKGHLVARRTVERLMRWRGLQGVRRGKVVRTTVGYSKAACRLDRINRHFVPSGRTNFGSRTSRMSRLGRAGSTLPLSSMSSLVASWAGGSAV